MIQGWRQVGTSFYPIRISRIEDIIASLLARCFFPSGQWPEPRHAFWQSAKSSPSFSYAPRRPIPPSSSSPLDSLAKFVPLSCSRSSFRWKKKSLRNTREKALGWLKSCWVPQPLEGPCNSLSEREREKERSLPLTKIRTGGIGEKGFHLSTRSIPEVWGR